jgi:menaquinone-dependent protoporphyrinogen oxidase
MKGKVLVAFATRYGSTGEVADAVGSQLREQGLEVDVKPAGEVDSLAGYSAVVLGGALYFFRWHRDARRFLRRHRKELAGLPVAIFAMGPINDVDEEFAGARRHLDKALARHAWLAPVSIATFGGRLEPSSLRFPHGNPAMRKMPASDIRDWAAIDRWADELAADKR